MFGYVPVACLFTTLTVVASARAAIVSADIVPGLQSPVAAGSTVPYEIHLTITTVGDELNPGGLCLFVVNLSSDLGVEQPPLQAFSLEVASGFTALQYGTPNSEGGLNGISAAQNCTAPAVRDVGLPGRTTIARGELHMPSVPGEYTVRVAPLQISLIRAEDGDESPEAVNIGTLSIIVSEGVETADGQGQDAADGTADAGTGGAGDSTAPPPGDGGTGGVGGDGAGAATGGLGGDGTTDGADGTGIGTGADTSGAGTTTSEVLTGGPAAGTPASGGLCGLGMLGATLFALAGVLALRAARRTTA